MTEYLTLTEFIPGTKAKAQEINANFATLKDAINSKARIDGDNTKTFDIADAALPQHAVSKAQLESAATACDLKAEGLINRFCLTSGNLTNGEADLLNFSGTTLSFKIGGVAPEAKWVSANGTIETITTLANLTGLSVSGTYSIIKELNVSNAFATASKVTQGKTYPTAPADGDYHCLTSTGLQTYKRVNGVWVETQYIQIGTATVSGGAITAVKTNLFNQNGYDLNIQSTTQNLATNGYTKLPNGLILQWGSITPAVGTNLVTVTFPIAFPNACFFANRINHTSNGANTVNWVAAILDKSQSQLRFYSDVNYLGTAAWYALGY